jgi:hypothetical protein
LSIAVGFSQRPLQVVAERSVWVSRAGAGPVWVSARSSADRFGNLLSHKFLLRLPKDGGPAGYVAHFALANSGLAVAS